MNKLFSLCILLLGLNLYGLDSHQVDRLSKVLYMPDQGDMAKKDYDKMNEIFYNDIRFHLNTLSFEEKKELWREFKEFYNNQIKLKKLFEEELQYDFLEAKISYKFVVNVKNTLENKSILKLLSDQKIVRIFLVDYTNKQKEFLITSFGTTGLLKVYLPYINTQLYVTDSKKNTIYKINSLLQSSHDILVQMKTTLGVNKR